MDKLLVAIDASPATRPVMLVGQQLAALLGLELFAVQGSEDGAGDGSGVRGICSAAAAPDVQIIVIGAGQIGAAHVTVEPVALEVLRTVSKPLVVVPRNLRWRSGAELRLLAPIDDELGSTVALRVFLANLDAPLDLILLRVFDAAHTPKFEDHGGYAAEMWCDDLKRRTAPREIARTRVELRVGEAARAILDAERDLAPNLILLEWNCSFSSGRGAVVKQLLETSTTPIALVPVTVRNQPAMEPVLAAPVR